MTVLRVLCIASLLGFAACGGVDSSASQIDPLDGADGGAQVCVPGQPDPRACDPADTKKTTVCHIPPGNPANRHTICIGNPGVPAHLAHGDFIGSCCGSGGAGGVDGGGGSVNVVAGPIQ
jgi:hypothetical protein